MIFPVTYGTGATSVEGTLSANALQASNPAQVVGSAVNINDTITQNSILSVSQAFTTGADVNAMAVMVAGSPAATSPLITGVISGEFVRNSDSAVFPLNREFLSSSDWDRNDPGIAILCGTGIPANTAGVVNVTLNMDGENFFAHAVSIIGLRGVASFGNIVTAEHDTRSQIDLTTAGASDGALFLAAAIFQGGGTDWGASAGWTAHFNDGTDDADEFNDITCLFQTLESTSNTNPALTMTVNSLFSATESCAGLVITAQGLGPS